METLILISTSLSLGIWLFLILFWGNFWKSNQKIDSNLPPLQHYPTITVIIPARNEEETIEKSIYSLLSQDYPGDFSLILVNDQSTDKTVENAKKIALTLEKNNQLKIINSSQLPQGWTGKLWALHQGVNYSKSYHPDYILLTDADIEHHPENLRELVQQAETNQLELVSLMVLLRCQSFWEKLLIPAFVFFFQKLYPFPLVNNPKSKVSASAGGCILIRNNSLEKIGGIECLKSALIDDCTLAYKVKSYPQSSHRIWLGLTEKTKSIRPYNTLKSIWDMIARTAYTQLNYSPLLLGGTVLGMILVYLISPIAMIWAIFNHHSIILFLSLFIQIIMFIAYLPTIRLYQLSPIWGGLLPIIGLLYNLMTIDSAVRHWRGKGGQWKGRIYENI